MEDFIKEYNEKRVLVFGIGRDRELEIDEYGDEDLLMDNNEDDIEDEDDIDWEDDIDECNEGGGTFYVRGCKGLLNYYLYDDWFNEEDINEFKFNIIRYRDRDIDWKEDDEKEFLEDFFNDNKKEFNEFVRSEWFIKKMKRIREVEEFVEYLQMKYNKEDV